MGSSGEPMRQGKIKHNVELLHKLLKCVSLSANCPIAAQERCQHHEKSGSSIGLESTIKRRFWIGIAVQLALGVLLGVGVAENTFVGRHLLVIAAVWFMAALAWNKLGPSFLLPAS